MPKNTFFNLPEEKRSLICDTAIDEFADYSFDQASINRIVSKSGISKGSFYQYFDDKSDLFVYIMQLIGQEKIKYISPLMFNPDEHDIFTLLREMYITGIQFVQKHPRYESISRNLLANKTAPIYDELVAGSISTSIVFFEKLLVKAIDSGEVRGDIDIKLFAYLISTMNISVIDYYIDYVSPNYDGAIMETVDKFIDFLRNGIGTKRDEIEK
ncbi:MAG: TetR/AcrR family transcriptional regulator [Anaerolineaceae bacterium]|nr:TetR/AcrR family transcriptional regulator [Anaerolineaceae bacterium]